MEAPRVVSEISQGATLLAREWGGLRMTEARHRAGLRLPPHAHEPVCLTYVLQGAFGEAVGGTEHWCTSGRVFLKRAGAVHANRYGESGARSLLVQIPGAWVDHLSARSDPFESGEFRDVPTAAWIAARLYREFRSPDAVTPLAVEGLVVELLVRAARAGAASGAGTGGPPAWLHDVRERLREEYRDPPNLSTLAGEAGVHPDHLGRAFRRQYGLTPGQWVRAVRADRAAEAVLAGERPLAAIAYEKGYADQSHFTREIKRHLGITPGQLRAKD